MQVQPVDTQRYDVRNWRQGAAERLQARRERIKDLTGVLLGYKLNLELLDRESRTAECSCCGVDCYRDGSHTQYYIDDGIACRYSEA